MKKIQIVLMAVLLAAGMGYSAVLTNLVVNFESDTVGSQPVAAAVRPFVNVATSSVEVVTGSAIGSGKAVRYIDQSTNAQSGLEYNFVASSNHQENAVGVKFTYTQRSTMADSQNISIAVGEYADSTAPTLNSGSRRIAEFQIRNSGIVRSVFGGNTAALAVPGGAFAIGSVNTVELFVNDQDSSTVNYVQGVTTYTLNANSYAIWVNGVNYGGNAGGLINTGAVVDAGAAIAQNTQWNLGRFSITSASGATGLDIDFDNIIVTSLIPEPATMGMLLLGAVTVLAVRRRRA